MKTRIFYLVISLGLLLGFGYSIPSGETNWDLLILSLLFTELGTRP